MSFSSLTNEDLDKVITSVAKVKEVFQTSGPTIFTLFDGSSNLTAKAFLKPGKRAYAEINKDDVVNVKLRIHEYEGEIESEIIEIEKISPEAFDKQVEELNAEKSKVEPVAFLIKSEVLDKLLSRFIQAASIIKKAIYEKRPIILRHNADCDGYSGAIALERSILPLLSAIYRDDYSRWRYYKRAPSRMPYYAYPDSLMDLAGAVNDMYRYNEKPPLIIIVDNGSSKEDVFGIRNVKVYQCPVVVVDHHAPDQAVDVLADVHINPLNAGGSSGITSGMLCAELSRFINLNIEKINFLPALSGIGDKSSSLEMEQYLVLAKQDGYDKDFLKRLALTLDFVAYNLRSVEARYYIQDLLGENQEVQLATVDLLYNEAVNRKKQLIESARHYSDIKEINGKTIAVVDLDKIATGDFPAYGKMTGMISDWLNEEHKRVYVMGISNEMVIFRVSVNEPFSIHDLIEQLKALQHANVTGGGHDRAGTIRFISAAKDEVIQFIKEYIGKID